MRSVFIGLAVVLALAACADPGPIPDVSVSVTVTGSGSVSSAPAGIACPGDCVGAFAPGTAIELVATADDGHRFFEWGGACEGVATTCGLTLAGDTVVTATFGEAPIVVESLDGTLGGPGCSLRDAITAANTDEAVGGCSAGSGDDVIELPEAATITLTESDNDIDGLNGLPSITSEVSIVGRGATLVRDSDEDFRFLHVSESGSLHVEDLAFVDGSAEDADGGAVYVAGGTFSAVGVTFEDNVAGGGRWGGAIYNGGGTVTLDGVVMRFNSAPGESAQGMGTGAAVVNVSGELRVTNSEFRENGSFLSGERGVVAAMGHDAYTAIATTIISNNEALGIFNEGELHLTDVDLSANSTVVLGGMINDGVSFLDNVTVQGNNAEAVSGVSNTGFLRLRSSTVSGHTTAFGFTGVRNDGIMEIIDSTISDNDGRSGSDVGGGITNSGRLTLVNSQVVGNLSVAGGGIWNEGQVILIGSLVDDNEATLGGGIYNGGSLDLLSSSVVGGEAGNVSTGAGGGIYVEDVGTPLRIALEGDSGITGNRAATDGGGIYSVAEFALALCSTCLIADNVAEGGTGGGIHAPGVGFGTIYAPGIRGNTPDAVAPGALSVISVAAVADDAEELRSPTDTLTAGTVHVTDGLLDLTYDPVAEAGQYVGIRFDAVDLPPGAVVVDARIVFTSADVGSGQGSVIVGLEDSVWAAPFTDMDGGFGVSSRPRVGSTFWEVAPWESVDESGPRQATPSLRNQVQQLIDGPGWVTGNPLAFIIESAGMEGPDTTRTAHAFDGDPAKAPKLWVLYFAAAP